jgi:hypothetical protein
MHQTLFLTFQTLAGRANSLMESVPSLETQREFKGEQFP